MKDVHVFCAKYRQMLNLAKLCGIMLNFQKKYEILRKNVEWNNAIILQRNNYPLGRRAELFNPYTPSDPGGQPTVIPHWTLIILVILWIILFAFHPYITGIGSCASVVCVAARI